MTAPATAIRLEEQPGRIRVYDGGRLVAKALIGDNPGAEGGWLGWRLFLVVSSRGAALEALRVLAPSLAFNPDGDVVQVKDGKRLIATAMQSNRGTDWRGWLVVADYTTDVLAALALRALAANPKVAKAVTS